MMKLTPKGTMAQEQKARKQPADLYAQRGKTLASSVQRLRGWEGSDPSRAPELADTLIQLTAHRLSGHGYAVAAADAQEAVRRAAQLLTANGPIGPYTSVADAGRYLAAVVHLATIQAGVGVPEAAGRTMETLREMQQQLREVGIDARLEPQTAIWALSCTSRAALAASDVAAANAYADAARVRLAESGLRDDPEAAYIAVDADRLAADCRWAAGRAEEALSYLRGATRRYEEVVAGRLHDPSRLSPALTERLAEPLFGLYRDLADRLAASGEVDHGLVIRRGLVDLLQGLAGRLGDPARVQLALAKTDLANDLLAAERVDEAEATAAEAAVLVLDVPGAGSTRLLASAAHARALTRTGRGGEAVARLRSVLPAETTDRPSAAHAVALIAWAEALRAEGDGAAAATTEGSFDDLTQRLLGDVHDGLRALSAVSDLARRVVSRGDQPVSWQPLSPIDAHAGSTAGSVRTGELDAVKNVAELRQDTAAWLEAERAESHRQETQRQHRARTEAERRAAERVAAERAAGQQLATEKEAAERAELLEAERLAAAAEVERLERKRRREERLEAHRLEAEALETERREKERLEAERLAAERLAADPAEAERVELERLRAELAELERTEEQVRAERLAQERHQTEARERERAVSEQREAEQIETQRREAEQHETQRREAEQHETQRRDAEQHETQRREAEQHETQRREAEQHEAERISAEQDELASAFLQLRDARDHRDRRGVRMANERLVELLRSWAQADLPQYGPQLHTALVELSSIRLRSGDVWGSRAAAKEAGALARALGR